MNEVEKMAHAAKRASIGMAAANSKVKNQALEAIALALFAHKDEIFLENQKDLQAAVQDDLAEAILKRLRFDDKKLSAVVDGLRSLQTLDDPVGKTLKSTELDSGLELYQVTCPIGVIGVVFESRPDALVQISALCLKSGNAVLMKGGKEALYTNRILAKVIQNATKETGIPENWLELLETRTDVADMLKLDDWIDLIIPRGSNKFVKYIMHHTSIPVLGHSEGLCHVYIDKDADMEKAVSVTVDAKTQNVAVCNAAETLLVHQDIAKKFLPIVARELKERNVRLIGCEKTRQIIDAEVATEKDWATEYLDYILSIRVVPDIATALDHINTYGSGHTEVIVTENKAAVSTFMSLADSGNVFWNCSSRFSDGYRYGFGAEVGISTNKIHARGPVGLEGLVIYKWLIKGSGQIVADYEDGRKKFTHKPMQKKFTLD
ncbi:MAG: glutamate-5-semialdehyde dehydrogenase [Lentisphaeria bacterium]